MLSKKLTMGLFLTCICMGIIIMTFVLIVMTPKFEWTWLVTTIFLALFGGMIFGANEINEVDKVLRKIDREEQDLKDLENYMKRRRE